MESEERNGKETVSKSLLNNVISDSRGKENWVEKIEEAKDGGENKDTKNTIKYDSVFYKV